MYCEAHKSETELRSHTLANYTIEGNHLIKVYEGNPLALNSEIYIIIIEKSGVHLSELSLALVKNLGCSK